MEIKQPTLLLDQKKCRNNIIRMVAKAENNHLIFRPHFKTHQSRAIGKWFREYGINKITVSSVSMARYFAEAGWNDITIAFPVNLREIDDIDRLAGEVSLNILISQPGIELILGKRIGQNIGVFLEIDCGYHRSGIEAENTGEIEKIMSHLSRSKTIRFKGFLTHSGNNYQAENPEQIVADHKRVSEILLGLKEKFISDFPKMMVSVGDTPGCSVCTEFSGIDEIRPGNFVFYDVMQYALGACSLDDIAVVLACPVVGVDKMAGKIIIYGGAVHLSKESMEYQGRKIFGLPVKLTAKGWSRPDKDSCLISISQEHGIISTTDKFIKRIKVGDVVGIMPVHSCLTAHSMGFFIDLQGNVIDHLHKFDQ